MFGKYSFAVGMLYLLRYLLCSPFMNMVGPGHVPVLASDPFKSEDVAEDEDEEEVAVGKG